MISALYYKELSYELLVVQRGFILCEAKRNKRAGARYKEMRKSSCILITKKPLLLDGRKSHFFWMKIPTSSGNRESGLFLHSMNSALIALHYASFE